MYKKKIDCKKLYKERNEDYQFIPHKEQLEILNYVKANPDLLGIILYWSLGKGKTCAAIMILDELSKKYEKVVIISSGSLRQNFIYQYCAICGNDPETINKFIFVTYNTRYVKNVPSETYNNAIIVIDEFHNLINGFINDSETFVNLFDKIAETKNKFLILLSGTPVVKENSVFFILKLLGINVEKYEFSDFIEKREKILYLTDKALKIIKPYISRNIISQDSVSFPKVINKKLEIVMSGQMSSNVYEYFRQETILISKIKSKIDRGITLTQKESKDFFISVTRLRSLENTVISYPQEVLDNKIPDEPSKDFNNENIKFNGWISEEVVENLYMYSPKINYFINYVMNNEGKHAIYIPYIERYGVEFISSVLYIMNIQHLIFQGSMSDQQRALVVEKYNSLENLMGKKYKVIIITNAAAEGQNFFATRSLHIMVQNINRFFTMQIIGRFKRFGSHLSLPEEKRVLNVFEYFGTTKNLGHIKRKQYKIVCLPDYRVYYKAKKKMKKLGGILSQLDKLTLTPQK